MKTTKKTTRHAATAAIFAACAALSLITSPRAAALDLAYDFKAGAGHSDNVGRNATNPVEQDIATVGLAFSLEEDSRRLNADVVGDFAYYEYLDDAFESEFLGNLAADLRFAIIEDRFEWSVVDNYGQVLRDPFVPSTTINRENINYFYTGPQFAIPLGQKTRLDLAGRYTITSYEESPYDSTGEFLELGIVRMISARSELSLHGVGQQVEYDESVLNADYDQNEYFVRYAATGSRTRLTADFGHTEIDQHAAPEPVGDLLIRLDVTRQVSSRSVATLSLGQQFASAGSTFAAAQTDAPIGIDTAGGRQTVDPFLEQHAVLSWNLDNGRTGLWLSGSWRDQHYELRPQFDQTVASIYAQVHRDMSPTLRLDVGGSLHSGTFEAPGGDYDDIMANVGLRWRMSRHLMLRFTYEYAQRDSDLASANYDENRFWLSIGYAEGTPRDAMLNDLERARQGTEDR